MEIEQVYLISENTIVLRLGVKTKDGLFFKQSVDGTFWEVEKDLFEQFISRANYVIQQTGNKNS